MHPMLGKFELAAGDYGMGDFRHGAYPPYVYQAYSSVPPATVNCGLRTERGQRNGVDPQMARMDADRGKQRHGRWGGLSLSLDGRGWPPTAG
jgi:hypothetical protein